MTATMASMRKIATCIGFTVASGENADWMVTEFSAASRSLS